MSVKFWRHQAALLHTSTVVCGFKMWQHAWWSNGCDLQLLDKHHAWWSNGCDLQLLDKHHQLPESKSNSTNVWAAGIYSLRIFNKHHFLFGGRGNHIHTVCNFYLFWSLHIYFCSWAPACGWVVIVVEGGRQIYGVWYMCNDTVRQILWLLSSVHVAFFLMGVDTHRAAAICVNVMVGDIALSLVWHIKSYSCHL